MLYLIGLDIPGHSVQTYQPYSIGELILAYRAIKNQGFKTIKFGGRI